MWRKFTAASTVHGFQYLAPPNGRLVKLVWLLAMSTAFTFCGYWIHQNSQEIGRNPISTTIQMVPISSFPFPTVTFSPTFGRRGLIKTHLHPLNVLEPVLNLLTYDCSDIEVNKAERENCRQKSLKVRNHFKSLTKEAHEEVYFMIQRKLMKMADVNFAEQTLCWRWQRPNEIELLSRTLLEMLKGNFTGSLPQKEIAPLFDEFFLQPLAMSVAQLRKKLSKLMNTDGKMPLKKECKSIVKKASSQMLSALLPFLFAVGDPLHKSKLPFGTLLANTIWDKENHVEGKQMALTLQEIIQEELVSNVSLEQTMFTLQAEMISTSRKRSDWFYHLAEKLVEKIGLSSDVLLPKEVHHSLPLIWACSYQKEELNHCQDIEMTFTGQGLGYSLNLPKWQSIFKGPNFHVNKFKGQSKDLKSSDDVVIYARIGSKFHYDKG